MISHNCNVPSDFMNLFVHQDIMVTYTYIYIYRYNVDIFTRTIFNNRLHLDCIILLKILIHAVHFSVIFRFIVSLSLHFDNNYIIYTKNIYYTGMTNHCKIDYIHLFIYVEFFYNSYLFKNYIIVFITVIL